MLSEISVGRNGYPFDACFIVVSTAVISFVKKSWKADFGTDTVTAVT